MRDRANPSTSLGREGLVIVKCEKDYLSGGVTLGVSLWRECKGRAWDIIVQTTSVQAIDFDWLGLAWTLA